MTGENEHTTKEGEAVDPASALFAVFDRREHKLPTKKTEIEIWKDGEWLPCTWHPRTPESKADKGYLGTARTTARPLQIGFHAWEQNEWEFVRYRIRSANAKAEG